MSEVILLEQCYRLFQRHRFLGRHQLQALFVEWGVHGDGYVTGTLVKEALELALDTYAADGDALGTPLPSPVGRHNFGDAQYSIEVVHRFSLSHEDDIRQLVYLRQSIYLVQDVGSGQVTLPSLFARLTEQTIHLAAYLTRDAQRGAVVVWDEDGLDKKMAVSCQLLAISCEYRKEVFDGTVLGALTVDGSHGANLEVLRQ